MVQKKSNFKTETIFSGRPKHRTENVSKFLERNNFCFEYNKIYQSTKYLE